MAHLHSWQQWLFGTIRQRLIILFCINSHYSRDNRHSSFYLLRNSPNRRRARFDPRRWLSSCFFSISLHVYLSPILAWRRKYHFVTRLCYLTYGYCLNSLGLWWRKITKHTRGQAISCLTDIPIPSCTPQPSLSSRWGWSCTTQHGYGFKSEIYILKWLQLPCTMPNLLEVWWVYFINSRNAAERARERQREGERVYFYIQYTLWVCVCVWVSACPRSPSACLDVWK